MTRSDLAAVLVVPLAAALLLAASAARPAPTGPAAARTDGVRSVPVTHASLTCPSSTWMSPSTAVAAAGSSPVSAAAGLPTHAARVSTAGTVLARLTRAGSGWTGAGARAADGLTVAAQGRLAAGLNAAVGMVVDEARGGRGLATATCTGPASHWWFVGAASTPDRAGVLHLTNPTPGVAVVDVGLYGERGPLDPAAGRGLALAPGQTRALRLSGLAPGLDPLAVEVTASQGRVTAAVHETARDVLDPAGVDFVPAAGDPRRTATLTGIPTDGEGHELSVLNPGGSAAVVRVQVLGEQTAFTPSGLESLRVPAHGIARTRLPASALEGDASGLRLQSDRPVTAAVRSRTGSPHADQSFAAVSDTLSADGSDAAATPVLPRLRGQLVLSGAGRTAAVVDVTSFDPAGRRLGRRTLELNGGQTRTIAVGDRRDASVQVRVGGSGPVAAAVSWTAPDDEGMLSSGFPLQPLRTQVAQPLVRYDLDGP